MKIKIVIKNSRKFIIMCWCIFLLGCTTVDTPNSTVQNPARKTDLDPCPKSPNCVSSMEPRSKHYVAPLRYTGEKDSAYRKLVHIIESDLKARIAVKQENYLRAEFRSAIFRFVDDVDFLFSSNQPVIEIRSASRLGYYDFGANRRRVEDIQKRWNKGLD